MVNEKVYVVITRYVPMGNKNIESVKIAALNMDW